MQSYVKDVKMCLKQFYCFNWYGFRCYFFTAQVIKYLAVKHLRTYLNFKLLYWLMENMESKFYNFYVSESNSWRGWDNNVLMLKLFRPRGE